MESDNNHTREQQAGEVRHKLDLRLAFLLSLPEDELRRLKEEEDQRLERLAEEIREAREQATGEEPDPDARARLQELEDRLFAPVTTGVYFPEGRQREPWPIDLREPYVSAFILSDASAEDLIELGVRVRSQAGDVFTALIPISLIARLEASPAVRFIELARPLFPTLDEAVPYTRISTLHAAVTPITGTGVIVGIVDIGLDINHPDFRTAAGATRVRYLWDQRLVPGVGEASPPTGAAPPGFMPQGGVSYGVEYNQAAITAELNNPPPAYQTVRHGGAVASHGTRHGHRCRE